MSWDAALGVPLSARDPNLLTTTWGYDGFGRVVSEQRPDQTSTSWTAAHAQDATGAPNTRSTEAAGGATGAAFWTATREVDHHDRVWKVAAEMTGGGDSVASVDFDARGRVSSQRLLVVLGGLKPGRETYDEWDWLASGWSCAGWVGASDARWRRTRVRWSWQVSDSTVGGRRQRAMLGGIVEERIRESHEL